MITQGVQDKAFTTTPLLGKKCADAINQLSISDNAKTVVIQPFFQRQSRKLLEIPTDSEECL
jgi:hypothetical protein